MGRAIAVLKLSPKIKNVVAYAQSLATAMTGNAYFPSPNPSLTTFQANIAALNSAEAAVLARTKGAVQDRNGKLAVLRTDLENLKAYVQTVADAATPTNAATMIESAG